MIALGWTEAGVQAPRGIVTVPAGALTLLAVPSAKANTARDILRLQCFCFDAGLDFVPLNGRQEASLEDAIAYTKTDEQHVLNALHRLRGKTELTVQVSWTPPVEEGPEATCGRAWLWQRQARNMARSALAETAAELLGQLTEPIGLRRTGVTATLQSCTLSLLLERALVAETKMLIAHRARQYDLPAFSLTVSGPWPPAGFALPTPIRQGHAA